MNRQLRGQQAEQAARHYLERQGLHLLTRNYRCRFGEIDLVMRDGETLVFVEVRYRRRTSYGSSAESVDWRKQRRLTRSALCYLQANPAIAQKPARFDVVALDGNAPVQWIRDAFQP